MECDRCREVVSAGLDGEATAEEGPDLVDSVLARVLGPDPSTRPTAPLASPATCGCARTCACGCQDGHPCQCHVGAA